MDNSRATIPHFGTFLGMGISRNSLIRAIATPAVLLLLVGCAQQPSEGTSAATAQPVTMTEQEALDAAQKAYAEYLAMSDLIAQEGGVDPERLLPLVSETNFESERKAFEAIQAHSQHLEGETQFDSLHIQSFDTAKISGYLCLDVSEAKLMNLDASVVEVPASRWPLIVTFAVNQNKTLIIDGSETWTGTNFC